MDRPQQQESTVALRYDELSPELIEIIRSAENRVADQRREKLERLQLAVKSSAVPISEELEAEISQLNPRDAENVLRHHPGFFLWERRRSYQISVAVFEQSVQDLLSAIDAFEEASSDEDFFDPVKQPELSVTERRIQKEMFAAASAAHALIDHSRRLRKLADVPDYANRLKEYFGEDGLHEFVIGLRTMLHQLHMVEAGWNVRHDYASRTRTATFALQRKQLDHALESASGSLTFVAREKIQQFLRGHLEKIDLRVVFGDYRERARRFHAWLSTELLRRSFVSLRDYERCHNGNRHFAARLMWKGLIKNWLNWEKPPNPFHHLDRFLTPQQLDQVYALSMGSKEQVDKVIEVVDHENACDVELRQLVYEFFRRSSPAPQGRPATHCG